jgi:5-methylcytosine-specific restriction protein A
MDTQRIHPYENRAVLKEYYAKYLKDVRKVKDSTVKHYFDALSYISRYLKEKNLLKRDIYEVMDLKELAALKEILYKDPDFINLNRLGHQMYSAGLNNYFRFASGEFIEQENVVAREMDIPMAPNALTDTPENPSGTYMAKSKHWKRSSILRRQALAFAHYTCELHPEHKTFLAQSTHKPYMEGHHIIPMVMQPSFDHSLDVYANLICLCPICHRKIHLGLKEDRKDMLKEIYDQRGERFEKSGLRVTEDEFIELGLR